MEFKTLILIDNYEEISEGNRDIVREVAKYILNNADMENKFSVGETGKDGFIHIIKDFRDEYGEESLLVNYDDIQVSILDILTDTEIDWKNNDYAYRDIVLISPGLKNEMKVYNTERLYSELSKEYPIYSVLLNQGDNKETLSTLENISRLTGGIGVYSETGSESGVEKEIGDKILSAMKENRKELNENKSDTDETEEPQSSSEIIEAAKEHGTYEEGIIYEMSENNSDYDFTMPLLIGSLILFIIFVTAFIISLNKARKDRIKEEEFLEAVKKKTKFRDDDLYFEDLRDISELKEYRESDNDGMISDYGIAYGKTTSLAALEEPEDTGTRLLYHSTEGVTCTLEDRSDPTKFYKVNITDRLTIGRLKKSADLALNYDDSVSGKHCELFLRGKDLYIRDLSSSNGTFVNQKKVYQEIKINSGDVLKIGRLSFFVTVVSNC